ncbi:MAG: hypothetical protein H6Q64_519 [Firmicutes bacterium]|nr:hypothetical protein [Bacillota bacterium]
MEYINHKEYVDDVIATSVGVEPIAMYYVQQRMDSMINGKVDELTEKDPMMAACVDEIIEDIDHRINNQLIKNNLQQDYVWFECPMDLWLDSQPELKKALESLPKSVDDNTKDDYVWFAGPLDKAIVSQLDARLADKHIHKSGINNDHQDYVWFEMILDKWIESQPGLKEALDKLSKMNKAEESINCDSSKSFNENKVA